MKALGLMSGGLDSMLAAKLVKESGVEVEVITFETPFCHCGAGATKAAETVGVPLKIVHTGTDYLRMVRNPKFGYGKNVNPCVDCHIFMIKKAKKYAKEIGAKFIFTGEVLGQRPMSQHRQQLDVVAEEAGLKGKLVRPLCAKLLPKTEAELKGYIKEVSLREIYGRSRKPQIELTKQFGIANYAAPAGGCLLTEHEFAKKLRDLFKNKRRFTATDVEVLRLGRHFRFGGNKIVVGRNQAENTQLLQLKGKSDYYFEVPNCGSPDTILQGPKTKAAIGKAAELTAFHSDKKTGQVQVNFGKDALNRKITITVPDRAQVDKLRI
jgi:tRNA-uridine 2-sulfurtransferase